MKGSGGGTSEGYGEEPHMRVCHVTSQQKFYLSEMSI